MIDTHTHLFTEEFDEDRAQVMERALKAGVTKLFMPNIDVASLSLLNKTCSDYKDYCFPMIGLHPTEVKEDYISQLDILKNEISKSNHYVGIGEVGLDFYWDSTFKKEQIDAFKIQIEWALEYDLPLIIHSRAAFEELYQVMYPYKETPLRGIFHSFTGDSSEAEKMLEFKNFFLGINGVVTFKKSTLPEVLKQVPFSRIVLETDSPYLAPVPYRGRRNESSYVVEVARQLALIYNVSLDEISSITDNNALQLFEKIR